MKVTVQQLINLKSDLLQFVAGDPLAEAYRPWPPNIAPQGSLVYVGTRDQLETALETPAGIIIAHRDLLKTIPTIRAPKQAIFSTGSIQGSMSLANPFFDEKLKRWPQEISRLASIHPSAKIGEGTKVGAYTVIGENAQIGPQCSIGPHCVIESGVKIGEGTYLHPFVIVGADCEIGSNCEINSHSTIGSDGFGYFKNKEGQQIKVPQIGRVVLKDRVEIGASCAIDRATLDETVIEEGAKLDNFCHVAHNCRIGKNSVIAARFAIAGSSSVGANFMCGGDVVLVDHIQVADNVTVGGRSAVTKDLPVSGAYTGYPILPYRDGLRMIASLASVPELRKELNEVKKTLGK